MGGLRNVIPDEGRELNLHDYGRNLSGRLTDSDGRLWETYFRSVGFKRDVFDATGARSRLRDDLTEAGGRVTWCKPGRRFLGFDYAFTQFVHDIHAGDKSKVRGPWLGAAIGQAFGRFTLTGALRLQSDDEGLRTDDVFAVRHSGGGVYYAAALSYDRDEIEVGVQAEHQAIRIDGVGREEARFHEDEFTWKRPTTILSGVVLWTPTERLTGAVRARSTKVDGRQDVKVSWSDRMPENPGRENFVAEAGTFEEKLDGFDIGTRWQFRLTPALMLAGEVEGGSLEDVVDEGHNFKGSRRQLDEKDTRSRAVAGAGYALYEGRLHVGVEGAYSKQKREFRGAGGTTETSSRLWELHTGAEYYLRPQLALRAGYIRISRDEDVDAPRTLGFGNAVTFGAGYIPHGGLVQIDLGVRFQDLNPDFSGDPHFDESELGLSLTARMLL